MIIVTKELCVPVFDLDEAKRICLDYRAQGLGSTIMTRGQFFARVESYVDLTQLKEEDFK